MRLIDAEKLHREVKEHCKKLIDEGVKEVDVVDIAYEIGTLVIDAQTEFAENKSAHTGRWISVRDRLPENEQEVLVISHGWEGRLLYIGTYKRTESQTSWLTGITSKASEWSLWGWSYLREPQVTHWMPLPELPEEVAQ